MIRKLQIKLIGASMLSLLVVLTVIVGAANLYNYHSIIKSSDLILSMLAENEGVFPGVEIYIKWGNEIFLESSELPYESRYFYIAADNSGNVIFTNIDKIAAVDEAAAMEYAGEILSGGRESGFIDGYRYIVEENEKRGYTYIIFLDCSRSLSTAKTFLLASITTSLIGLGRL